MGHLYLTNLRNKLLTHMKSFSFALLSPLPLTASLLNLLFIILTHDAFYHIYVIHNHIYCNCNGFKYI